VLQPKEQRLEKKEMKKDWAGKKEDWSWKKKVDWEQFGAAKKRCMGRMEELHAGKVAEDAEEFQALIRRCAEAFAGMGVPKEMAFDWTKEMAKYVFDGPKQEDWIGKENIDWNKVKGLATYAETYFSKDYPTQDEEAREKMHHGVTERLKRAGLTVEKAEGMWRDWVEKASP